MKQKAGMLTMLGLVHMLGDDHSRWDRSGRLYRRKGICQMVGPAQENTVSGSARGAGGRREERSVECAGAFYLTEACRGMKAWACPEEHYEISLKLTARHTWLGRLNNG